MQATCCGFTSVDVLERYETHAAGGQNFTEYWIPAEELGDFNDNIVDDIEFVQEFRP